MALQRIKIGELTPIGTTAAALTTNPAATKTWVRGVLLHNTAAVTVEVSIHWVQPSAGGGLGVCSGANRIFCVNVAPKESLILEIPFSLMLDSKAESVQAVALDAGVQGFVTGDRE